MGYPAMLPLAAMPHFAPGYSPYAMVTPRPDGQMPQMVLAAPPPTSHYAYPPVAPPPQAVYQQPKQGSRDVANEMANGQVMDPNARRMGDGMVGGPHGAK